MRDSRIFWAAAITAVIWVALTAVSIIFMTLGDVTAPGAAVFIVIMMGLGIGATIPIWGFATSADRASAPEERTASRTDSYKFKRGSRERLARLLEQMDDDDIVELESLLSRPPESDFDDEDVPRR